MAQIPPLLRQLLIPHLTLTPITHGQQVQLGKLYLRPYSAQHPRVALMYLLKTVDIFTAMVLGQALIQFLTLSLALLPHKARFYLEQWLVALKY